MSRRAHSGHTFVAGRDIRAHAWFTNVDWEAVVNCRVPAPIHISAKTAEDTSNFDDYGDEDGPDANAGTVTAEQQKLFEDF